LKGKKMATTKPVASKATSKTTTAKKPATAKPAAPKKVAAKKALVKKAAAKKTKPSAEALYKMTEVAAYYIALNDGFAGSPSEYWLQAEIQISKLHK
jgi:hypothetical protein